MIMCFQSSLNLSYFMVISFNRIVNKYYKFTLLMLYCYSHIQKNVITISQSLTPQEHKLIEKKDNLFL